ncbi:hypothetical protein CspHIS471_0600310 [Cutaneotrichosporon sp. HIS471]|nr:hypothetical protein CspHIS471_0600310 [Cutaneotrichosporon sp. HIS471]
MVGFVIPIPSKVVDNVYKSSSNLVNSYKKEPLPTDLSARPGEEETGPPPAPAPRRTTNTWAGRSTAAPPPRAGYPARAAPARAVGETNLETFGPQLLAHVLGSISLLESVGQITPEAARKATAALDGSAPDTGYAVPTAPPARGAARAPPPPPAAPVEIRATALWEYGQGGDDDDLAFKEGDTVIIDEEVNDEWLRGRTIPRGRTMPLPQSGLFPRNYVQRL